MKRFIWKIRNKRLKGNVSLLVILILLASSIISLLSINQIQRLISYWNMTFNYFRSFYIAKAWTELGLTEVYHREAWFDHIIDSWDAIVLENLVWIYTWFNPYFKMTISWEFKYLTDDVRFTNGCSGYNKITLGTWEWIMLSLFKDKMGDDNNIINILNDVSEIETVDLDNIKLEDIYWSWSDMDERLTFWLFDYYDSGMDNIFVETTGSDNLSRFFRKYEDKLYQEHKYLTIKNPWTSSGIVSFCISNENKFIPYSDYLVTVQANYWDMEVWLQSVVKNWVPSWALDVLWR